MIKCDQMPDRFIRIIDEQIDIYNEGRSIQVVNRIPDTTDIPIDKPKHWLKIPDVICVFVDMKNSTKLSASTQDKNTAGAYQLFTGTAVRLFAAFESPYIDLKGDGVFALFDKNQSFRAIAAAVTFKTFAQEVFVPTIEEKTKIEIGSHTGIDQKTVLVRKLGFKRYRGRSDRQNEVWAGKPVNMAAKLASLSENNELIVSDRFYNNIQNNLVTKSCGCPDGEKKWLWSKLDLSDDSKFDFDLAYRLESKWCEKHGNDYCEKILALDTDEAE